MTKDIVCGREVDERNSVPNQYAGQELFFCSRNCLEIFHLNPLQYFGKTKEASLHENAELRRR